MEQKHYRIRAKERTTGRIVTPEYIGGKSRAEVIAFFGLEEPDIEWYQITEQPYDKNDINPKREKQ
ncbi:MAG: hypothetical protein ACI305_03485 [Lepagella sp.]